MKGSAIYLKNMNRVLISDCLFKFNGPVFSVKETKISPYVAYLSKRAITYFDETGTCGDEFEHL